MSKPSKNAASSEAQDSTITNTTVPQTAIEFEKEFYKGWSYSKTIAPDMVKAGTLINVYPVSKMVGKDKNKGVQKVLTITEEVAKAYKAVYDATATIKKERISVMCKMLLSQNLPHVCEITALLEMERSRVGKLIASDKCIYYTKMDKALADAIVDKWEHFRNNFDWASKGRKTSDGVKRTPSEASKASSDKKKNTLLAFAGLNKLPETISETV